LTSEFYQVVGDALRIVFVSLLEGCRSLGPNKGPFVSGLERPGTISGLKPFDILYWAGNIPGRSRPGMLN